MTDSSTTIAQANLWPEQLEKLLAARCTLLRRAIVLRETDSTQQAARRLNCQPGDVVIALRQTHGRGRLGRSWADTHQHGVAMTLILHRDARPERLAIATAIAIARAIETLLQQPVGIKWPNDILVHGRKIAGILIEQADQHALIGIGVNVTQERWPDSLAKRAVSMRQLGSICDRLQVICAILPEIERALDLNDDDLVREFQRRDALIGTTATFRCGEQIIHGEVIEVDALRGLRVRTLAGEAWLPAALTSVDPGAD